jgi:hypothetical protein
VSHWDWAWCGVVWCGVVWCGVPVGVALYIFQPHTSTVAGAGCCCTCCRVCFPSAPCQPQLTSRVCVCVFDHTQQTQVWNTLKKKPVSITRNAHAPRNTSPAAAAAAAAAVADGGAEQPPASGSWATANVDTPAWIQSVAVAPLSDLVASGAGDGFIRLWGVQPSKHGGAGTLRQVRPLSLLAVWGEGWSGQRCFLHLWLQWTAMQAGLCACLHSTHT